MNEINLLPEELKPSGNVLKISSTLKKIALLSVSVFIVSIVLYFGASIFLDQKISESLSNQESIKNQIKALEKTEHRLVLVKDRLDKIASIGKNPRANDELVRLNNLFDLFPENTYVEEVKLNEHSAAVAVSSDNLDNVASYLASVVSSGKYDRVNLAFL